MAALFVSRSGVMGVPPTAGTSVMSPASRSPTPTPTPTPQLQTVYLCAHSDSDTSRRQSPAKNDNERTGQNVRPGTLNFGRIHGFIYLFRSFFSACAFQGYSHRNGQLCPGSAFTSSRVRRMYNAVFSGHTADIDLTKAVPRLSSGQFPGFENSDP